MFGKRADGKAVKGLNPFYRIIPYIMKKRSDSQVFFEDRIYLDNINEYINNKKEDGIRITHMDIMLTAMGRLLYERPHLNRFVMNGRIYQRNEQVLSLAIKKKLLDDATETTVKFRVNPEDTVLDVSKQVATIIQENKEENVANGTDKLAKLIMSFPNFFIKSAVGIIMLLDKHGMLPKKVIDASPFHTSAFLTNLGSLGINSIYHHIYDFGTTSIFFAMGNKRYEKDAQGNIRVYMDLKVVADERICDGLYYARSFLLLRKYFERPELLEEPLNSIHNQSMKDNVISSI